MATAFSSSSADCAGLQSTETTCAAPWMHRLSALQPPLVSVRHTSPSWICSTCGRGEEALSCHVQDQGHEQLYVHGMRRVLALDRMPNNITQGVDHSGPRKDFLLNTCVRGSNGCSPSQQSPKHICCHP